MPIGQTRWGTADPDFPGSASEVGCGCRSRHALQRASDREGTEYAEVYGAYCLAAATIFRSMTFLAASIAGSSVNRRVLVPFSFRNCWMYESS